MGCGRAQREVSGKIILFLISQGLQVRVTVFLCLPKAPSRFCCGSSR